MGKQPTGVGIGLRREFAGELLASDRPLDFVEVISENYLDHGGHAERTLERAAARWPVACHGVALSVGGPDPLDGEYLKLLRRLLDRVGADYFSDHLCFTSAHGIMFHELLPLPFTEETVHYVAARAREAQDRVGKRLLLENVSTYVRMPGGDLTEGEFTSAICTEADCGLLLDVNNVYVNAFNHGEDPLEALLALPLDRVGQYHLAGHRRDATMLVDDHGHPICDDVWQLYREALRRTPRSPVLVEWDLNIPPLATVLDQADAARAIYDEELACSSEEHATGNKGIRGPEAASKLHAEGPRGVPVERPGTRT